jgi:hypothetical protein
MKCPQIELFAAYKVSRDGLQTHYDYVRNLTQARATDEKRFPLGIHEDKRGIYSWGYGCNNGVKF